MIKKNKKNKEKKVSLMIQKNHFKKIIIVEGYSVNSYYCSECNTLLKWNNAILLCYKCNQLE